MKTKYRFRRHHLHISLLTVVIASAVGYLAATVINDNPVQAGPPSPPAGKTWQLAWADEFDGSSVDTSKWNIENNSNFGSSNKEDECYMASNVGVSGGSLKLTAQRQTVTCGGTNPDTGNSTYYFTSGLVTTRAQSGPLKQKFKQGYFEAKVKSPKGNPYWPAFWLVGPNDGSTPGWPDYGEFDIFEHYGARPDVTNGSMHYKCTDADAHCQLVPTWYNIKTDSSYGGTSTLGTHITTQAAMDAYSGGTTDYQIYGFLWEADKLHWYVNGRKYRYFDGTNLYRIEQNGSQTLENSTSTLGTPAIPFSTVFAYDHSIILNLAVGGNGPRYSHYGYTGQDTAGGYSDGNYVAANPGTMEVDYVRVYQLANAATPTPTPTATPTAAATPTPTTPTPTAPAGGTSSTPTPTPTPKLPGATPAPTVTNPATGEEIKVASDNKTISGSAVLSPELATDPEMIAAIAKVEYYVDGKLKHTLTEPPFQFNTYQMPDGVYSITEKIYKKDGTVQEQTARVEIMNAATKKLDVYRPYMLGAAVIIILGGLFAIPFTRRVMLTPVRFIRKMFNPRTF